MNPELTGVMWPPGGQLSETKCLLNAEVEEVLQDLFYLSKSTNTTV